MTLTGLYPERGRNSSRWIAVWRTPRGNFTHVTLPMAARDVPEAEAKIYAAAHPPEACHGGIAPIRSNSPPASER